MFKHLNELVLVFVITFSCCVFVGCNKKQTVNLVYNASESCFFTQNNDFYYYCNGDIIAISKKTNEEYSLLRDPFSTDEYINYSMILVDDELYYFNINNSKVYKLSLNNYISKTIYSFNNDNTSGFLGVLLNKEYTPPINAYNFFTDGTTLYFMLFDSDGVFKIKRNKSERLIDDRIYNDQLAFDGNKIYYINSAREFICFDITTYDKRTIATNFANALYYDGMRVLFSDKNGIFSLNTNTNEITKLSDNYADRISSDGNNIVFQCNNTLFFLAKGNVSEIESIDFLQNFSIIKGTNQVLVKYFESDSYVVRSIDFP